ncbi:esterase-like activity of phytase family protein [Streptomyces sp. NPDC046976]|uniref:esterase-like activity of phytase family protein n=1 Tax=Streptomyces sp. NPDC046976 TaxID=3155258 RepID=UPI0033EC6819
MHIRTFGGPFLTAAVVAASLTGLSTPAQASPKGPSCSAQVAVRGFSDALDKTSYKGTYVGNLSSLTVDQRGRVSALSDRSMLFGLDRDLKPDSLVTLADEAGKPLDSEGLVIDRDGTRLVSSETEPSVRRFSPGGRLLERLPVPPNLAISATGGITNRTFEGLTLDHTGRTLTASMEGWLRSDGIDTRRFQTWERRGRGEFRVGPQYAYTAETGYGISEIAATRDGRYLVLERSFAANIGWTAKLYVADPRGASDVTGVASLTSGQQDVRFMHRTLLADLDNCPAGYATSRVANQANPLIDNIEGMAITEQHGKRLRVLMITDDDESQAQTTRLYSMDVRLPRR